VFSFCDFWSRLTLVAADIIKRSKSLNNAARDIAFFLKMIYNIVVMDMNLFDCGFSEGL